MSLISCPACKREVSDLAQACPHCGHPLKSAPKKTSGCAWVALIVLVLFGLSVCQRAIRQVRIDENGEAVVAPPESSAPTLSADVVEFNCTASRGGMAKIQGSIKNTSTVALERLNLKGQYRDAKGALIGNGEGYVDNHSLAPGETTPFEIIGPSAPYASCEIAEVLAGFDPVRFSATNQ